MHNGEAPETYHEDKRQEFDEYPVNKEDDIHLSELVLSESEIESDGGHIVMNSHDPGIEAEQEEGLGVPESHALTNPRAMMILNNKRSTILRMHPQLWQCDVLLGLNLLPSNSQTF